MSDASKAKPQRASTSSKNRQTDSPPPYRSHAETTIEEFVNEFWQHAMNVAEHFEDDFKHQALPLARIKKVAKMDPEVQNQMISSEVTILFEKACQTRAHLVSLAARRRTLSRADVAQAVSRSDMFDFLIDIVPRTEQRAAASASAGPSNAGASTSAGGSGGGSGKRPARSRKHSQRDSSVDEYALAGASAAAAGDGGEADGAAAAKRFRLDESDAAGSIGTGGLDVGGVQVQEQPHLAGLAGLDPAAAAAAAGYYMPTTMPDGTTFPPGQMPWGSFDYSAAPADPAMHAYFHPTGGQSGTNGNGASPDQDE
ncbi:hypothetical protein Rhopal_007336-T1 [Rhodotorula paludigena]|uniref:Transcription factor CBF/NF-Y/archaeal histone domain-containing protein n=1 Tax=Rhodotorula paludigena TaxID=86838 RepID=A0AAV5GXM6_9BASI|nr:hypothetical protein Rhopal_007336-T1 [Rhodotorula paludigena]